MSLFSAVFSDFSPKSYHIWRRREKKMSARTHFTHPSAEWSTKNSNKKVCVYVRTLTLHMAL